MRNALAEFAAGFARLKQACGGDPQQLEQRAPQEAALGELAAQVDGAYAEALRLLGRSSQAMRAVRDESLRASLEEYTTRFAATARAVAAPTWQQAAAARLQRALQPQAPASETRAREANPAALVSELLADVQEIAYDHGGEAFGDKLLKGLAAWEQFEHALELDLFGISRRWRLMPPELLNPGREPSVMQEKLRSAARAFVYGCVGAAVALARDLMRDALADNYGVPEDELEAMIVIAEDRHPALKALRLNSRRRLAEDILAEPERAQRVGERAVADLLDAVAALLRPEPRGGG